MKKLNNFVFLFFIFLSFSSYAQTVEQLKEELSFNENGKANLKVSIKLEKGNVYNLLIPYNFNGKISEISTEKGFYAEKVNIQGINYLFINRKDSIKFSECNITVIIDEYYDFNNEKISDFGNYLLKYRYINTRFSKIKNYLLKIVLPQKYNITSVDESIPEATEDSPKSPFKLGNKDGKYFVELTGENVKLGENLYIKFRFKENNKSILLAILLGFIAIGYLIIFKDLRKSKAEK
ncbi:MAG TPA: hypothetical protein PL041_06760 [Melioribacteraceae bacterium]|nr:hypothetical protein [Melioribacteraceae bacterium]